MRKLGLGIVLVVNAWGCAGTQSAVMEDPKPPTNAWTEIALQVTGPAVDGGKRKACLAEARKAGIYVRAEADTQATIYLSDEENRVEVGGTRQVLDKRWTTSALCRVALAQTVKLDQLVRVSKTDASEECKPLGTVQGDDNGFAMFFVVNPGTYEAAVAAAQFNARARGANWLVVDVVRQLGLSVAVNGRAFQCPRETAIAPARGRGI